MGAKGRWLRRSCAGVLVLAAAGVGYAANGDTGSPHAARVAPHAKHAATRKLTLGDMMLIASRKVTASDVVGTGIHLRFPGITTGGMRMDHANDIPINSFQFGVGRGVQPPPGRGIGNPSFSEATITHQMDQYSLKLIDNAIRGKTSGTFPTATIFFTDTSGTGGTLNDYLKIDLSGTIVSGYSMSSGGDNPSESLSLNYSVIKITAHIPVGTTQTVSYDLVNQV